jgi:hypothetical protein
MARPLRQNTDQYVSVGPALDKTVGLGNEDALTVTNFAGVIVASTHSGASTHTAFTPSATAANDWGMVAIGHGGFYDLKIPDSEINFVGTCMVGIWYDAEALPFWHEFEVLPANVWDAKFGTDLLDVNQAQVLGTAVHASSENGTQCVEVVRWGGQDIHATTINGVPIVQQHTTGGGVDGPTTAYPANFEHLAITDTTGLVSVGTVANDAITAAAIANGAIDAATFAAGAIDAAAIANGAIDNATFAADVGSTAYATNIIALAADKAVVNAALGTAAELAKVPKSDSSVSWNATALAAIQAEANDALVANNLDHLALTATAAADMTTEVADNTILSRILGNGDTSTFVPSTDGLHAAGVDLDTSLLDTGTTIPNTLIAMSGAGFAATDSLVAIKAAILVVDDFVDTEVASILAAVDTEVADIKAKTDNLPQGIKRNTALADFEFVMVDATTKVPTAALTPAGARSIDGGAFAACTNTATIAEVGNGVYAIDLAAADLNGTMITLRFTAAGADDTLVHIKTNA